MTLEINSCIGSRFAFSVIFSKDLSLVGVASVDSFLKSCPPCQFPHLIQRRLALCARLREPSISHVLYIPKTGRNEKKKRERERTNLASQSLRILLLWRRLASLTFTRAPGSLRVKWRLLSESRGLSGLHSTPPCTDEDTEICAFDLQPGAAFLS